VVEQLDIVVVGAGPAGLSAAGALAHRGRRAVVLERDDRVGARWESRYDRLHLHTVRRFSGLAHYRIPRAFGRYPSKDAYAQYLRGYVDALGLEVRTGLDVQAVRPRCGRWEIETNRGFLAARAVVLATGRYDEPVVPKWPGSDGYRGRILHAASYTNARDFAGASVLVVGIGNSGAEIAAELAESRAKSVAVAVRTAPPITPRELFGLPIHLFGLALAGFPPAAVDRVGAALRRMRLGDLSRYGLPSAEWGPFVAKRPPVIDVGFLRQLKAGRIAVKRDVVGLTAAGAAFADGSEEAYDVIVAATGFRSRLERLVAPQVLAAQPRGLHMIGYRESVRGALFEIGRDSRALARSIDEELEVPCPTLG
jgi:putative flavoprotein involved in K+ transport